MPALNILVAQGGGPTAVINQSLAGVVLEARRHPGIGNVYGARNGVKGIVRDDLVDLGRESAELLEQVATTPAAALGSTRDKPDAAYCAAIFETLRAREIGQFFYIGGNDSSDTVRIVSEAAQAQHYPLSCIHIPKTIDNDLMGNDHTPGYPSAARFVAQAFAGADLDNAALPGVYIGVVMGRHAGFLTAAAAAARRHPDDGPHLIYLPERHFDTARFLAEVQATVKRLGRCVVAVSEGIHDADGQPMLAQLGKALARDDHGNVQLSGTGALADLLCDQIKSQLGLSRVRGDTLGYLQRSFVGCVSELDQRVARAVGEHAVRYAMQGHVAGSVSVQRRADLSMEYPLIPLTTVAARTRTMDDAFIAPSGSDVTPAFLDYLTPLLGGALPVVQRLRAASVPKVVGNG